MILDFDAKYISLKSLHHRWKNHHKFRLCKA